MSRLDLETSTQFAVPVRHAMASRLDLRPKTSLLLLVWLASGIFVYLQVFILPATPRAAIGDQSIYVHHAVRMLEGEMIYRDYDHFTLPGTDVFYMTLFKLFGVHAWIPQAMLIVLGMSMVYLMTFISRKLMGGTSTYLPGLLFIALPFSGYLDASHHWYSTVATTAALAVLLKARNVGRLAWAGVLVGVATFFTQSMALLPVGLALFLLWERGRNGESWGLLLKKELSLLASFLATAATCLAYFVWKVGFKQLLYYTVVFVVKYYPADRFNTWRVYLRDGPHLRVWSEWLNLPAFALVHLIVPTLYILFPFLASYVFKSRKTSGGLWNRLMLVNLTGLFLFLTVASAPVFTRLYAVSGPALVLLVWLLDSPRQLERTLLQLLWATVFAMAVARPLVTQIRWKACLDLPTGRTAFFEPIIYEKTKWLAERTRPHDYFLGDQLMCFALRLRNVGRVPFLRPTDYTRPEEVQDAVQALERFKVRFVSWYSGLDHRDPQHPEGDHLAPIRLYLHEHYHIAHIFANGDQIWERN